MAVDLTTLHRLATEARATTEDAGFRRAYEKLYSEAFDLLRRSLPEETAKREEAYWRIRTLEALDQEFAAAMQAPALEGKRQDRQR